MVLCDGFSTADSWLFGGEFVFFIFCWFPYVSKSFNPTMVGGGVDGVSGDGGNVEVLWESVEMFACRGEMSMLS